MKPLLTALFLIFLLACKNDPEEKKIIAPKTDSTLIAQEPDSLFCRIRCPKCKYTKKEKMPTEVCQLKYTCDSCRTELLPKEGDCCVFCTYGDKKCPSMQ